MRKISIAVIRVVCGLALGSIALETTTEAATFQTLYSFTGGSDGETPDAGVIVIGSKLYGTTTAAYAADTGFGTVYSLNTDGSGFQTFHAFNGADGANPEDALTAIGSTLYGTTQGPVGNQGGKGVPFGTVFAINTDGSNFQNLHLFPNTGPLIYPQSAVTLVGSTLYGTTVNSQFGGTGGVYSLGLDGSNFSVAQVFPYQNGAGNFVSGLTLVGSTLYGVTASGGVDNVGTIFTMNSDGSNYHVLYSFSDVTTGPPEPQAGLIQVGSELYGTTGSGGPEYGSVFSIGLDGSNFQTLHSFNTVDGDLPAALTLVGSTIYGTSLNSIFSINPDGSNFQVVYHSVRNGPYNFQGPLVASGNTLYGTTVEGGMYNHGTVFALTLPEPSSIALLAIGAVGLAALARRRAA